MNKGLSGSGRKLISAALAAKELRYAQDYIGQLARSGKIPGKKIGRTWYVDVSALVKHKLEKSDKPIIKAKADLTLAKPVTIQPSYTPLTLPAPAPKAKFEYKNEKLTSLPPLLKARTPRASNTLLRDAAVTAFSIVMIAGTAAIWFASSTPSDESSANVYQAASMNDAAATFTDNTEPPTPIDQSQGVVVAADGGDHQGFIDKLKSFFSDEVNVTVDRDGVAGVITPSFSAGTSSGMYSFLLVPVKPK